jgi:hypothetical protein
LRGKVFDLESPRVCSEAVEARRAAPVWAQSWMKLKSDAVAQCRVTHNPEATGDLKKRGMRLRYEPNQFQPKQFGWLQAPATTKVLYFSEFSVPRNHPN